QVPLSPEKNGTIKINGKLRLPGDLSNLSKIALEGTVTVSDLGTQPMELYLSQVFAQKLESGAVSLDAEFEGTLDGHIRSSGKLTYRFGPGLMPPGLYKEIQQSRGSLSYDLAFQNDTLKVHKLLFHSGAFSMNARGTYARFLSDRAQLDVFMKTSPFSIENSESHLPFKIFSKELHHRFREIIPRGELEIASLEFKGPVSRFREISKPEILEDFSGVLLLRRVNVTPPEFSLHQVEGEVHFQKGSAALKISKARYGHLVLTNVLGAVSHPLTRPEVKATLEAQGALAPLVTLLEQREAPRPRKGLLEQIKHIKGIGRGRITVEGILESPDSLKWSGDITIERAGFLKEKWPAPFRNVNGQLHFEVEGDTDASSPGLGRDWRIEFDQFSGEILKHSFSRLKGEWLQNKNLRTADIQANLRLAELKAESILPQKVAEPVQAAMKDITLAGAEINLSLQSQEPVLPGKDSTFKGSLDIHNLFVRHAKGYPPLNNVQGTLAFDPKKIVLKTKSGWYGTSPFTLVARLRNYRQDDFNLILSMESAEFAHADFAGIPFLETLKYRGPAHLKIKFLCNRDTIKLKQHIDLKRASYQFGDFLIKPENVANFINISASRDDEGRLSFNHLEVGLADNRVTGQGYLRSLDDPEFALKMASDRFQVWPASQYIRPLKGALGGRARFQLSAKGHFRHLEDAVIKGKVALNRIEYHPDPFRVPIVVSAGLKFLNHRFTIHKGKLSAKNASLFFEGDYRGGTSPHMKFRLTGPGINLNEIVAAGGKPSQGFLGWLSGTRVFSLGSGEVHIDVGRFTRDFWTFPRFTGDFTFKDQTLKTRNLEIGRPKVDQIMVQGQLKLEEGRKPAFDAVLVSRNIPSKNFFKVFGGLFQNGLTGHLAWLKIRLKGQGDNLKEI
nr:hypothetical protein [Nitrospinaceae bacterium]